LSFSHLWHDQTAHSNGAEKVGFEDGFETLVGGFFDGASSAYTGIVDEDVDLTCFLENFPDCLFASNWIVDVELDDVNFQVLSPLRKGVM